jgi:hypothetical protein
MMRTLFLAASALIGALAGLTDVAIAGAHSGCAELGGNVQSGNVCHAYADTPGYTIDLSFGTDYPDDQPVTDYLSQNRDQIVNAAQAPGARNLPYMMNVTSETYTSGQPTRTTRDYGQPWHGTQSLVLRNFQSVEGAPVGTKYKTFTFDFDQNRPVTFGNLFAPGTSPMDSIYPAVAADLARQQIDRHFQLPPSVGRDPAHYQNFAITDDTVIFFFDTGEFLPAEAGYLVTPVSRASLPPLQL